MAALEHLLSQEIVQKLGWALLHFTWQAATVAIALAILLRLLRKHTANLRYGLACVALAVMVLLPTTTIMLVSVSVPSAVELLAAQQAQPTEATTNLPATEQISSRPHVTRPPGTPSGASESRYRRLFEPALPYLVFGWLSGVLALSLWYLSGWARLQWLTRKAVMPVNATLELRRHGLADKLGVHRAVKLWESAMVHAPAVVGWLRPVVLLPVSAMTGLGPEELEALIAHELAHIRRHDYLVNMLQTLVEILGFYHPAVWWASHQIRIERENCCDDLAVSATANRVSYAKALAAMEEMRASQGELAIAASGGSLLQRIQRIVGRESPRSTSAGWIPSVAALLLLATTGIPTTLAFNAPTKAETARADIPAQSLTGAAADSEKPEQPRFPARTFNSKMAFDVAVVETAPSSHSKLIGSTPSATPLAIPACRIWWVQPSAPVEDWDLSAREINENRVPGLKLDLTTNADGRGTRPGPKSDSATDADMKHLAGLTGLQQLDLSHTQVGDAGLAELKGLRALESLKLVDTQVTDAGLGHLKGLTGLRELSLWNTKITDAGLAHLKNLTGLRRLDLMCTQVTDSGLALLEGLAELQGLYLMKTQVTDLGLEHLKDLKALEYLLLDSTQITDAGLAHLQHLSTLKMLDVGRNTRITDAGLVHLEGLARLESLNLEHTAVTDAGLVHLRGLTRLNWLCLLGTKIDGTGLAHLKSLTGLEFLNLTGTQVTDAGLANLKGLTGLRTLWLLNTNVTDVGLSHLQGLTGLEYLVLSKTQQVREAAVEQLKQSLPKLSVARW